MAAKDNTLVGSTFSRLTVAGEPFRNLRTRRWMVNCRCVCGTPVDVLCQLLVTGHTRSCGCLQREKAARANPPSPHPSLGDVFDRLTITGSAFRYGSEQRWHVRCICECGSEKIAECRSLRSGETLSCGCLQRSVLGDSRRKHGHSRGPGKVSSTYITWSAVLQRCLDEKSISYPYYGARGIKICERWRDDFCAFLEDMGERPDGMTLDRFPDKNGHYEPGNCRWATNEEQANNKRNNVYFEYMGEMRTSSQIARAVGLSPAALRQRLSKGWSLERATTEPIRRK